MLNKVFRSVLRFSFLIAMLAACEGNDAGSSSTKELVGATTVPATATVSPTISSMALETTSPNQESLLSSATPGPATTSEPTPTLSWIGPDSFPEDVNPLTGLKAEDSNHLERRPIMIKVSNYPASLRPHSGLSYADMVFSYFIGVGMTRYLALYYGQDAAQVGPVRSGRLIDSQLVNLYGGFLGMVGADRTVWAEIASTLPGRFLTEMPINCPALCDNGYGTSFANTEAFTNRVHELGLDDQRPELTGMRFDAAIPEGGAKAGNLWLYISYYNQVGWDYQRETRAYQRSQENTQPDGTVQLEPMTDRITGEQLAFDNVVILFAWHNIIKPELIAIELQTVENGRAILFRDGLRFEVTYSAVSPYSPLRFYDSEGEPISFKPGNTWFEVVGLGTTVEEPEPGSWKIRFYP